MPEAKVRFCDLKPGDKVRVDSCDPWLLEHNGEVLEFIYQGDYGTYILKKKTGARKYFHPSCGVTTIGWLVTTQEALVRENNSAATCPKNNDGRTTCAWCGAPTRKAGDGAYDICTSTKCGK